MQRNPRDIVRYTAPERLNHWIVGICFILLALSGLAFFHPAFFPLTRDRLPLVDQRDRVFHLIGSQLKFLLQQFTNIHTFPHSVLR